MSGSNKRPLLPDVSGLFNPKRLKGGIDVSTGGNISGDIIADLIDENGVDTLSDNSRPMIENVNVQVLQIYRFLIDDEFEVRAGIVLDDETTTLFGYDIVVSDGRLKTKCLLHPNLNRLINRGELRVASIIHVVRAVGHVDELTVGASRHVKLEDVQVLQHSTNNIFVRLPADRLSFRGIETSERVRTSRPLFSAQLFYMPFGNEDCMSSAEYHLQNLPNVLMADQFNMANSWKAEITCQKIDISVADFVPVGQLTLQDIMNASTNPSNTPLVARVVSKSRLLGLVNGRRRKKCPFYFCLELMDGTVDHPLRIMVWETLCPRYFSCIRPGHIIRVKGYRLGKKNGQGIEEIKLNPGGQARIELLQPKHFQLFQDSQILTKLLEDRFGWAHLSNRRGQTFKQTKDIPLMNRSDMSDGIGDGSFGIVGVLSFVGATSRVRRRASQNNIENNGELLEMYVGNGSTLKDGSVDAEFYERRWIKIRDGTSGFDLPVLLYTNSQPEIFQGLGAGDFIALTNLALKSSRRVYKSFEQRSTWAIGTIMTRIVTGNEIESSIVDHSPTTPFNRAVAIDPIFFHGHMRSTYEWWKMDSKHYTILSLNQNSTRLLDSKMSPYIPTRLRPTFMSEYSSNLATIIRLRDLDKFLNGLHWSESRLIRVQGIISALTISGGSARLSIMDTNDPSGKTTFETTYCADETFAVPLLPFSLESSRRSGTLPRAVSFAASPFASRGLLSKSCCDFLGQQPVDIILDKVLEIIGNDLAGKQVVVFALASKTGILLESVFLS